VAIDRDCTSGELQFRPVIADDRRVKRKLALLLLAASGLAAAGCGSASNQGSGAASIVPASVVGYIAIDGDPNSSEWQLADDLASRFPGKQKAVSSLEQSFRSDTGLDFQRDVKPALGPEIDVVWLDLDHGGRDVVALTQPADETAFERVVKSAHGDLVTDSVDGWEVLGADQTAIDAFKRLVAAGGATLDQDPGFKQAMGEFPADALVRAWLDGASATAKLRTSIPSGDTELFDKLGTLDWLAASLSTSGEGVRLDLGVRGEPGSLLHSSAGGTAGFHPSLPSRLPSDVLAYLAFHGTRAMFAGVQDNPALAAPQLATVRSMLGNVGALLSGEDALYVRPGSGRLPEVTLLAEPSAGTDGAATLDRILGDVKLGARLERGAIAGTDARTLPVGGSVRLHYANVDGKLVVTDLPAGIAGVERPGSGLSTSEPYSDAVRASGMPDKVQSFLYVNVRGGLGLVQRLANSPIPASVAQNLGPLKSAVEYAATRPSEVQVTFFVRIS
jgi:hypothetical protein